MSASASTAPSSSSETGPVYFWHEYDEPYGYLSQWYECAFEHEGNTYLTAEMWMMVQKAVLFGDDVGLLVWKNFAIALEEAIAKNGLYKANRPWLFGNHICWLISLRRGS